MKNQKWTRVAGFAKLASLADEKALKEILVELGYAPDAEMVVVQATTTIGYGPSGSVRCGVPFQILYGRPQLARVADLDLSVMMGDWRWLGRLRSWSGSWTAAARALGASRNPLAIVDGRLEAAKSVLRSNAVA